MALTILQIMDDVTLEAQGYFDFRNGSSDIVSLMTTWLNETQKDLLHTGIYRHILRAATTVATGADPYNYYALTPTDVRRVEAVYSTVNQAFLSPLENVFAASSLASPEDRPRAPRPSVDAAIFRSDTLFPSHYWLTTDVTNHVQTHTLHLFPAAQEDNAGNIIVYYVKRAPDIAHGTDNDNFVLDVDAKDALVAGIMWRMYLYLDQPAKADRWKTVYDAAKLGETV